MITSKKGQAWYVLRGYRYQLLRSLDAWLGLRPGEDLLLETEEDFSVKSATVSFDTQVKSSAAAGGPKSHSLRSKDVHAALGRFWTRSDQGRDPRCQLAFIAQGGVAREQGISFPNNVAGIDYWRSVVLGADSQPIRAALASLFEGQPIGDWINENPSDEELGSRLLNRIRWIPDALDEGPLTDLVRDRIAELYLEKGLWATLADAAVPALLDRVFETATQPNEVDRSLTAVDLHRSIEITVGPTLSLRNAALIASSASADGGDGLLVSTLIQSLGTVAPRSETVAAILTKVRGEPLIWFHGSHGIGKSTMARLIALEVGGTWLKLDLRPIQDDPKAVFAAWRELLRTLHRTSSVKGIVVDDLSGRALDALRARLSTLITSLDPGTRVIVTSAHEPSAARLTELGASQTVAIQAPYFTQDDIRALVTATGGPRQEAVDGWTRLLFLATNNGHPLLVAAKVANLRFRDWPPSALADDLGPLTSDAVRNTRDEARRRLLDEIPSPEARLLLRRLGSAYDRVDDALALKLAHQSPPNRKCGRCVGRFARFLD